MEDGALEKDDQQNFVDEVDLYNIVCEMGVLYGALAALHDGLLNSNHAQYTLSGCEFLSMRLLDKFRALHGVEKESVGPEIRPVAE
jgi:hypothetical protein